MATAFAQAYNSGAQTVAADSPVTFSAAGVSTAGVAPAAGSADITLAEGGTYLVYARVISSAPAEFAVALNDTPVAGGTLPAGSDNVSAGTVIVQANPGDVLTIRNIGAAEATLPAGSGTAPMNASVFVQLLAPAATA